MPLSCFNTSSLTEIEPIDFLIGIPSTNINQLMVNQKIAEVKSAFGYQFNQHFMCSFFIKTLLKKKILKQAVSRKKAVKNSFFYQNTSRKMLVKLTTGEST
jgi:hypothetical protein